MQLPQHKPYGICYHILAVKYSTERQTSTDGQMKRHCSPWQNPSAKRRVPGKGKTIQAIQVGFKSATKFCYIISVGENELTHWDRVTHICVSQLISIVSDNGLSPDRRQAIIQNNDGILLFGPVGRNFSEILIKFIHFHSRKCIWKCHLENDGHLVSASMC